MEKWTKTIPESEIKVEITEVTVDFADKFGTFLGTTQKDGNKIVREKLTTSQLRKFFGEVKRQQMVGYKPTDFILLKPKLAYAVGRAKKDSLIEDFYFVMADAIDKVKNKDEFKNFIKFFEAIVAYHKRTEAGNK